MGSQAPSSHLLMKRTTNMDPPRPLVAASTSSYVRINLFGIDGTLKPEIVTATLSANDPPRAPGSIGYLFDLNDDSRIFLVQREEVDDSPTTTIIRSSMKRQIGILYGSEGRSSGNHRYSVQMLSKHDSEPRFRQSESKLQQGVTLKPVPMVKGPPAQGKVYPLWGSQPVNEQANGRQVR